MREGQDRDFRMVLIEDCCSALTPEEHEQAVATLRSFGEVTTSTVIDFRS
jgi:nicotinamidase-related amidase